MEFKIDAKPILILLTQKNVFDNSWQIVNNAIKDIQNMNGLIIVGKILKKGNEYMIFVAGNIGNRDSKILSALTENGCELAKYVSDAEANKFIENQDIYC